jgi:RES domain
MAPFILAFGDLNRHVMRCEPTSDPHQQRVNAHSFEDDHHWPWYLEDYRKLGHDLLRQAPTETMRFLWSDETMQSRLLLCRLAHLIWGASPAVRLAVIEAIEETGNVLFALTARLAKTIEADSGTELRYCGEFHFQLESGHAMNNDHAELARIELDADRHADALHRDDLHTARWAEALHHQCNNIDGLMWMSKQRDRDRALMLFGDRVRGALTGTRVGGVLARNNELREAVLALALRAGIEAC